MRKFCVYVHRRLDTGAIFYVGKGFGRRPHTKQGRSQYWHRIVNKHGYSVEIVLDNVPEPCAFTYEMALIAAIGRDNLCNATDGGQGTSGRIVSASQRAKCSASNKGTKPHPVSIELARLKNSKPIGTTCGLKFPSATEAAKHFRKENWKVAKVNICQCANGITKTAYGYTWRYIENGEFVTPSGKRKISTTRKNRKVSTECGIEFDSIRLACEWLKSKGFGNVNSASICNAIKKGAKCRGYRWRYV